MYHKRGLVAEVDLSALRYNIKQIRNFIGPKVKIMPVIKANSYGLGIEHTARVCEEEKTDYLAVACIYEVAKIRETGVKMPILNLGPMLPSEAEAVMDYDYTPTVFNIEVAKKLSSVAQKNQKTIKIHIKVDTGMNRIGVRWDEACDLIKKILALSGLEIEGVFTHFANSDEPERESTLIQLERFNMAVKEIKKNKIKIKYFHSANSGGVLYFPQSHMDIVRPGTLVHGFPPNPDMDCPIKLKPLLTLKSYITHIKEVPAQTPISYGWTFCTRRKSIIASLPMGYADGIRRAPVAWKQVLVNGRKAPVVGRVCMDQTMIDVTDIKDVRLGDEVVLIGSQGKESIDIWQATLPLGTIAHEFMVSLSQRVTRIYKD